LPKAALGKDFAEGFIAFAEGRKLSAKILSAVVMGGSRFYGVRLVLAPTIAPITSSRMGSRRLCCLPAIGEKAPTSHGGR